MLYFLSFISFKTTIAVINGWKYKLDHFKGSENTFSESTSNQARLKIRAVLVISYDRLSVILFWGFFLFCFFVFSLPETGSAQVERGPVKCF